MFENPSGPWALIVHGGAKQMAPGEEDDNRRGVLQALAEGRKRLEAGGSAVDAVEAVIRTLEDLPVFNAGHGSSLNAAGEVEMCSGMMDGRTLSVGAVGAIRGVRNPVSVARAMLDEKETLIVGEGASLFARRKNIPLVDNDELVTAQRESELAEHDTVGAVALDMGGNIAAGTSTGGLTGAPVGRIGDSPVPGCGFYADNHVGAVAFSGDGETIQRLALAGRVMAALDRGEHPEQAVASAVALLPGTGGAGADGGGIAITKDGRVGWAHNSPDFAVAMITSDMTGPKAWLGKKEEKNG
ncbi:isoaspartyl peptidase/L-asparaginase family protein [Allosphingosinicella deserti]|uniref:Isoaspartyl peptidase n=1 Tax=Allosphingosinicella deserti TaxID=2116704 RepID=A0A2P7QSM7_9SPHN|nr:isoaspartyl peptidase/L-asparaginase family protein [Sphingomonas deserti]PSJ40965.1 asparaginase [Sphingomonas deserti]